MPVPERSGPLDPDERRAILAALTTGGRSQRSVAADPAIRGTHDQIRALVRDVIRDDPSLLVEFPKLSRRPAPEVRIMDVVDADGESAEQTAAASVVAAGVPLTAVRIGRVVVTVRSRIHFVRNPDGSFAAVRAQQADTRVEWVPVVSDAPLPPAPRVPTGVLAAPQRSAVFGDARRMSLAVAMGLVGLLLLGGAAMFRLVEAAAGAPVVGVSRAQEVPQVERP